MMTQHQTLEGCLSEMKMLERVKYFPRQLLTADDMKADQEYFLNKLRRHNRYLHGWGTVCGLEVLSAATKELPWRVEITAGYALGPKGDEIYVQESVFLDLARCGPDTVTDPCDPDFLHTSGPATGEQLFVAIKYAECLAKPVQAMPAGCGCEEDACEYSRIRDSFQIECLTELPPSHEHPPGPMLCDLIVGKPFPACPPCPSEPWVVLAQVTLPASPSADIEGGSIDNFTYRRQVFSTAMLQEQLIKCCCKDNSADLEITETREILIVRSVANITWKIRVTNHGPSIAQNVKVVDKLSIVGRNGQIVGEPDFSASHDGEWTTIEIDDQDGVFECIVPVLPSKEVATMELVAKIKQGGVMHVKNSVRVSSDNVDPNPSNNFATAEAKHPPSVD